MSWIELLSSRSRCFLEFRPRLEKPKAKIPKKALRFGRFFTGRVRYYFYRLPYRHFIWVFIYFHFTKKKRNRDQFLILISISSDYYRFTKHRRIQRGAITALVNNFGQWAVLLDQEVIPQHTPPANAIWYLRPAVKYIYWAEINSMNMLKVLVIACVAKLPIIFREQSHGGRHALIHQHSRIVPCFRKLPVIR